MSFTLAVHAGLEDLPELVLPSGVEGRDLGREFVLCQKHVLMKREAHLNKRMQSNCLHTIVKTDAMTPC